MKKILTVEDDQALRETLAATLESEAFRVVCASNGVEGLKLALEEKPDLIVLDIVLPGMTGLDICKKIREKGVRTPIIFLTGQRKEAIDKVLGLELGGDDYLVKPFGPRELVARIHAILRRIQPEPEEIEEYSFGDVILNFKGQTARKKKKELSLTAREYSLLKLFVRHEGEVISRDMILNEVWGYEKFPTTRTVDTFIHNLRHKIEDNPAKPRHLLTVPWSGYKFKK